MTPAQSLHPLDPFSAEELTRAVAILSDSGRVSETVRFSGAFPIEPPKDVVRGFVPGTPFERELRILGYDRERTGSFDARVSLSAGKLSDFSKVQGGQSPLSMMDFVRVIQIVKADPQWQDAMRKRGIDDFDLVQVDPWPAGGYPPEGVPEGTRMMRAISFLRPIKCL